VVGVSQADGSTTNVEGVTTICCAVASSCSSAIVTEPVGLDSKTTAKEAFTAPSVTLTATADNDTPAESPSTDTTLTLGEGKNLAAAPE